MSQWDAIRQAVRTLFPELSEDARQKLALSPEVLKRAYRTQMLHYHPDRHQGNGDSHEHACDIQAAYRLLDEHLQTQQPHQSPSRAQQPRVRPPARRNGDMRFGEFLMAEGLITHEELNHALREQHHRRPSFGSMAVSLGYLGPNELARWLEYQSKYPERLGSILIRERRLTQKQVEAIVAAQVAYCEPIGVLLAKRGVASQFEIEAAHERFQHGTHDIPRAA